MSTREQPLSAAAAPIRDADGSLRLSDDWRRWIAENLLTGHAPEKLLSVLPGMGCPAAVAKREIESALKSPYLRGSAMLQRRIEKIDWLLRSYGRLSATEPRSGDIERKAKLPPAEFFRDHYAGHSPVILTGLIDHWPAMQRWSLDFFERTLGDVTIEAQTGRDSDAAYEIEFQRYKARVKFRDLIARMRTDHPTNDFYITANNTDANRIALAPLWQDIGELPDYLVPSGRGDGFFWMGPRGTITPFHHDLTNNLLMQIRGTKRISLIPSWETPRMANYLHCYSRFRNLEALAAIPEEQRPPVSVCTLQPGEVLFIPVGWWHYVEGLETTIGLSFTNFARANDFHSDYKSYGSM